MNKWVGIDVGGTTIKGAAVFGDGSIAYKTEIPTESELGSEHMLANMAQLARDVVAEAGWSFDDVKGIGVGIPALGINFATGVVEEAVNIGWKDVPLAEDLGRRLGKPVQVENDANAAALGEALAGGGKGFRDALCVTLGTGVGGGVIVEGKVVHGSNGCGGEIGHITILREGGRLCGCGRYGCLETISSATGIVKEAEARLAAGAASALVGQELSTRVIFEAAVKGDAVAQEVVAYALDTLGFALANIGVTTNPQVIVVGGGVSKAGEALLRPLQEAFARYAVPRVTAGTTIRLAELGNDAGVIGAALLFEEV